MFGCSLDCWDAGKELKSGESKGKNPEARGSLLREIDLIETLIWVGTPLSKSRGGDWTKEAIGRIGSTAHPGPSLWSCTFDDFGGLAFDDAKTLPETGVRRGRGYCAREESHHTRAAVFWPLQ